MNARAIDILGRIPPLDLADYSYIEIAGLVVELRDGFLTIRNAGGTLLVKPLSSG